MNRTTNGLLALVSGLALAVTGTTGALAASGDTSGAASALTAQAREAGLTARQAAQLQDRIDARLATMKTPAEQVRFDEIRAADGTRVTFGARAAGSCTSGRLCLWAGDNYDHEKLTFYKCAFRDLSDYGFNDRLTSLKNYQSKGTWAKFYNWEGHWSLKFGSTAPHKIPDLQGTEYNNVIDGVRVC
ncbi:peptidase inhibitor family I36 protein [Streptomyces boluensis]|uniref:Peptidase inhibitor family I36 n=1 Tax=Streptomyces boluensis TaxID=1775135 RepID=A0A964XK92_9ACTN|nr:peptidase inhibitor family I36 protein [Streptomyces boluensis]NBE50467.1 hypothetical protein [Streptomyces boluensis]